MPAETDTLSAVRTLLHIHRGRGFQQPVLAWWEGTAATVTASQGSMTDNSSCSLPDSSVYSPYLTARSAQQRRLPCAGHRRERL